LKKKTEIEKKETILLDEDDQINIGGFVAEEILLSLPMFPKHENRDCHQAALKKYQAKKVR